MLFGVVVISIKKEVMIFLFGPILDFYLGFDNDQRLTPTNDKP